ncbi:MAG: hypothetical protein H7177_04210 [Rhizobacter sp.]|nr:hypothetical protein [Bacteriovorax sp.]
MKASILAFIMVFLVACNQEATSAKINTLVDNQITISSNRKKTRIRFLKWLNLKNTFNFHYYSITF